MRFELGLGSNEMCPESKYPRPINYPGTIVHYVISTSLGTLSFLAFGTTKNIYLFWMYAGQLAYKREWDELRELFTNKKAFAAMHLRDLRTAAQLRETEMENKTGNFSEIPTKVSHTSTTEASGVSVDLEQHELTSDKSEFDSGTL